MTRSKMILGHLAILTLTLLNFVDSYWRMSCGLVQTGRIDPVISPGSVSGHVHKISGANTLNANSTYESLQNSRCTSCEVQKDLSGYWTPQLYFEHANGSFEEVSQGVGTVVYYLGRGNVSIIKPFPPGFRMLSGNAMARSYDSVTLTAPTGGRPIADRVSFACISSKGGSPQTHNITNTDCDGGLRAQINFPSCWDGKNLYMQNQSHVAYMSQIDNGVCPPSHPIQFVHLFFEL
jgi:hypothetical protein